MRRFLTGKQAADRLAVERSTFYKNHRRMGLYPVDFGVNGKPLLRWPEDEVERYITRKLADREQEQARINQIVRFESTRAKRRCA